MGYHKLNAEAVFFHDDLVAAEAKAEEETDENGEDDEKRLSQETRYSQDTRASTATIISPPTTSPEMEVNTPPPTVAFSDKENDE